MNVTTNKMKKIAAKCLSGSGWRFESSTDTSVDFWCRGAGNSLDGIFRLRTEGDMLIGLFIPGSGEFEVFHKRGKVTMSSKTLSQQQC